MTPAFAGKNLTVVIAPGDLGAGLLQPAVSRAVTVQGHVSYRPPLVTAWRAPEQPLRFADASDAADRYWIEVHGQDFGGVNLQPTAFVGEVPCRLTVWVNDTFVRCEAPSLVGKDLAVSVIVKNQGSWGAPAGYGASILGRVSTADEPWGREDFADTDEYSGSAPAGALGFACAAPEVWSVQDSD